jgi:hypothetical protein
VLRNRTFSGCCGEDFDTWKSFSSFSDMDRKKYLMQNGILTLNPRYGSANTSTKQSPVASVLPLAIISSQEDVPMIQQLQSENGIVLAEEMPFSTVETIRYMQTPEYCSYFNVSSERNLFDELCSYFIRYEIPIGLVTKLLVLRDYRLNFMVDDSGDYLCLCLSSSHCLSGLIRFHGK